MIDCCANTKFTYLLTYYLCNGWSSGGSREIKGGRCSVPGLPPSPTLINLPTVFSVVNKYSLARLAGPGYGGHLYCQSKDLQILGFVWKEAEVAFRW